MSSPLIVYFDYKSPYAFVAKAPIYELEKDFGIEVEWRPYSLHIPDFLGTVEVDADGNITGGTRNAHQWRRTRYLYMDARRLAKDTDQDLIIKGPARGALYDQILVGILCKPPGIHVEVACASPLMRVPRTTGDIAVCIDFHGAQKVRNVQ